MNLNIEKWFDSNKIKPEDLAIIRILFGIIFLFFCGMPRFEWISNYNEVFYRPPTGVMIIFSKPDSYLFLTILSYSLPVSAILILVGYRTKLFSILFGLLFIYAAGTTYSIGGINHSVLIPFTSLIFAFSGWGNKYSIDSIHLRKESFKPYLIKIYSLIFSFAYFTAGFVKLIGGWLSFKSQASQAYFLLNYFKNERTTFFSDFFLEIQNVYIWELADWLTPLVEISPLLLIFHPKLHRYSFLFLALFHLFAGLSLGLYFGPYIPLFCIFIISWKDSKLLKKIHHLIQSLKHQKKVLLILLSILLFLYFITFYFRKEHWTTSVSPIDLKLGFIVGFLLVLYFTYENILIDFEDKLNKKNE